MRTTRHHRAWNALIVCSPALAWFVLSAAAQTTPPSDWTWMGGSSTVSCLYGNCPLDGVYGVLGTPAAGNTPGSRSPAASWTDKNGNFWLFGGSIPFLANYSGIPCSAYLNDLWKFNPSTNEWAWMSGPDTFTLDLKNYQCGPSGTYGTLGVSAAGNVPGGRWNSVGWTDSNGNFWLFGGFGLDINNTLGYLNDLWMFNPSTNEWTWMGGSSKMTCAFIGSPYCSQNGVPGTLGTPAAGNIPGGRSSATGWTDSSGRFWLFGGSGLDPNGPPAFDFNDLWEFDPLTNEWAWISGSNKGEQPGVYGTLGMPAPGNTPGSRSEASGWTDNMGNLWLFGGRGADANVTLGDLNDLWEFNPFTREWAWMGGSNTLPSTCTPTTICGQPGNYGTSGVPAAGNTPGGRGWGSSWTDNMGDLWLFGGKGADANATIGDLNDLWEFNPSLNQWAWMAGSSTVPPTSSGNGGQPGVYGNLGVPAAGNIPGGRSGASGWTDGRGYLWLYGGDGIDAKGNSGFLDDLWEFNPPAGSVPPAARPVFSEGSGTYTSTQSVSISDDTPGAMIYYTTDGVTIPTTSSTPYSGPITVSSSETIIAIAISSGFSISPIASAVYTILPPSFTVGGTAVSIAPGATTGNTSIITLTPANGFTGAITLTATIASTPSGAVMKPTLSFGSTSPVNITGETPGTAILTIATTLGQTQSCTADNRVPPGILWYTGGSAVLACVLLFGIPARRRKWQTLLGMAVLLVVLTGGVSACGGGGGTKPCVAPTSISPSTTAGAYTITVTGSSGTTTATGTITLNVH